MIELQESWDLFYDYLMLWCTETDSDTQKLFFFALNWKEMSLIKTRNGELLCSYNGILLDYSGTNYKSKFPFYLDDSYFSNGLSVKAFSCHHHCHQHSLSTWAWVCWQARELLQVPALFWLSFCEWVPFLTPTMLLCILSIFYLSSMHKTLGFGSLW